MKLLKLFGVSSDGALLDFIQKNPELKKSKELIEILGRLGISVVSLNPADGGGTEDGKTVTELYGMTIDEITESVQSNEEKLYDISSFVSFVRAVI